MSSAAAGGTEENDQMLALEQRLLGQGFGELPTLLRGAEDFPFDGDSVAAIVTEALRYLQHQYAVDLVGARVLAALGEAAVRFGMNPTLNNYTQSLTPNGADGESLDALGHFVTVNVTSLTPVPEPGTWALMGAGLFILVVAVRRQVTG